MIISGFISRKDLRYGGAYTKAAPPISLGKEVIATMWHTVFVHVGLTGTAALYIYIVDFDT
jgi:hypothetical protein